MKQKRPDEPQTQHEANQNSQNVSKLIELNYEHQKILKKNLQNIKSMLTKNFTKTSKLNKLSPKIKGNVYPELKMQRSRI